MLIKSKRPLILEQGEKTEKVTVRIMGGVEYEARFSGGYWYIQDGIVTVRLTGTRLNELFEVVK